MTKRRQAVQVRQDQLFKGRQFTAEVILWAVRWYLMFPISYRDLELMLLDRGVKVDHSTISRWIQAYAVELEKRIRPHLRMSNGSWRVDETYVKVKGRWMYLYRAVDSRGQTIDFLLSAKRDAEAAKRFFRKALAQPHTVNPRTITVDKNAAYPKATAEMKKDGELWPIPTATGEIPEQYRGARSPAGETINRPGTWLWWLLHGPTNVGRLRGDGDDQERAGSKHRRQRHQGPGRVHRRTVPGGRLRRHLVLSQMARRPPLNFATEPTSLPGAPIRFSRRGCRSNGRRKLMLETRRQINQPCRRCADQGGFHVAVDTGQDHCANRDGTQAHGDLAEMSR